MGTGSIKENVMLRWMLVFCLAAFVFGFFPLAASAGKAQTDNLRGKVVEQKPVQGEIRSDLEEGPGDGGESDLDEGSSSEDGPLPDNGAAAVKNRSDARIYEGNKDGGTKGVTGTFRTVDGLISVIEKKNIEDVQVATDWNLPKKKDGSFDVKRLKNSVRDQKKLIQESKAKYFYIFTHYDRPEKGKGYQQAFDMEGILYLARAEYAAAGLDVEVLLVPNPTSVDAKGQYDNNLDMAKQFIAETKKRFPNKKIVFVYNNVRNYAEEQSDDAAVRAKFEKQLIAATGVPVMEAGTYYSDKIAFYNIGGDKIHRDTDASVEQGQLIAPENRAAGQGIITTMDQVNFFQKNVKRYSVIGGGKKFDKFVALSRIAALADKTKGFAAIFGALGNEVSARLFGVPVGSSLVANKARDIKKVEKGIKKLEKVKGTLLQPSDYVVTAVDSKGKPTGERQTVSAIPEKFAQFDIGPETTKALVVKINGLGKEDGLIINGGPGAADIDGFEAGTYAMFDAAFEAAKRGAIIFIAGADINKILDAYMEARGITTLPENVLRDLGGGALLTALGEGVENMPAAMALVDTGSADGGNLGLPIPVLSTMVGLLEGGQTGGYNIELAVLDDADGVLLNHSEQRLRMEQVFGLLVDSIIPKMQRVASIIAYWRAEEKAALQNEIMQSWKATFKMYGLDDKAMAETIDLLVNLDRELSSAPGEEKLALLKENTSRSAVNKVWNTTLKKVIAYAKDKKLNFKQTVICVGETLEQYNAKRTNEVIQQDIQEIFDGVTGADLTFINARTADEPRWKIGPVGEKLPITGQYIQDTAKLTRDTVEKVTGARLPNDFGGSLNAKNAAEILRLPDVSGGLIAGAALTSEKIAPVIDEAIKINEESGGKRVPHVGMNFKAYTQQTGLQPFKDHVATFAAREEAIRAGKVTIAISTSQTKTIKGMLQRTASVNVIPDYIADTFKDIARELGINEELFFNQCCEALIEDAQAFNEVSGELFVGFLVKLKAMIVENKVDGKSRTLVLSAQTLRNHPGVYAALGQIYAVLNNEIGPGKLNIAIFGDNADKVGMFTGFAKGSKQISRANTYGELVSKLNLKEADMANTVVLITEGEKNQLSRTIKDSKAKVVVSNDTITLSMAKAMQVLYGEENLQDAFSSFFKNAVYRDQLVPVQFYAKNFNQIVVSKVMDAFEFPDNFAQDATQKIAARAEKMDEFWTKIGV